MYNYFQREAGQVVPSLLVPKVNSAGSTRPVSIGIGDITYMYINILAQHFTF